MARPSARVVESVKDEYEWMPHGQAGDDSVTNIPFQVLSSSSSLFLVYIRLFLYSFFLFQCFLIDDDSNLIILDVWKYWIYLTRQL